jgi:hypothetical protein
VTKKIGVKKKPTTEEQNQKRDVTGRESGSEEAGKSGDGGL